MSCNAGLNIAAVMATLFIPEADEFEKVDRFFAPNHTAATYQDAHDLQLPSAVILARGYNCICISIIVFCGALFLIMSASETGRRPVLGGSELHEIQRALHTSLWYKNFRLILFILMALQGLAIVLMILTAVDMINIRLPAYGKASGNPIFSGLDNTSYASYWKERDYTRWVIPVLFVLILFLHLRIYAEATNRRLTVSLAELEARMDYLRQLEARNEATSKFGMDQMEVVALE
jgi:hypothetical protein